MSKAVSEIVLFPYTVARTTENFTCLGKDEEKNQLHKIRKAREKVKANILELYTQMKKKEEEFAKVNNAPSKTAAAAAAIVVALTDTTNVEK
jgi:hypothetical protein